jgi:hypothetical protein
MIMQKFMAMMMDSVMDNIVNSHFAQVKFFAFGQIKIIKPKLRNESERFRSLPAVPWLMMMRMLSSNAYRLAGILPPLPIYSRRLIQSNFPSANLRVLRHPRKRPGITESQDSAD